MLRGTEPTKLDRKDFSFHRTFPQFGAITPAVLPLLEYNYDLRVTMYDQNLANPPYNVDPLPYGCTGFTSTDICSDQDGKLYSPQYTYERTCYMEGHEPNQGCQVRTSMASLRIFPPQVPGEEDVSTRRSQYFNVDKVSGRDWFDSFRIALRANKTTKTGISMGIPWHHAFSFVISDGILMTPTPVEVSHVKQDPNVVGWHDVKVSGEKTMRGEPYLCLKPWQGPNFGDNGWVYMNRECFNKTFDIYGTIGLCPGTAKKEDVKTIVPDLYQWILILTNQILAILGKGVTIHA